MTADALHAKFEGVKMKRLSEIIKAIKICDHNESGEPCQNCPYSMTLSDNKTRVAWYNENGDCMDELKNDAIKRLTQLETLIKSGV